MNTHENQSFNHYGIKNKKTKFSNVLIINIEINNESKVIIKNGLSNR